MSKANVHLLSVALLCAFLALAHGKARLPEPDEKASHERDHDEDQVQNDDEAKQDDDGVIYGQMIYNEGDRATSKYAGAFDALRGNYSESIPNYNAEKRSVDRVLQLERQESRAESVQQIVQESSTSNGNGGQVVEELDLEELLEGMEIWERQEDGTLKAYRTVRSRGQLEKILLQRGDGSEIEYDTFKGLRLVKDRVDPGKEIYVSLKGVAMRKLLRRLFVRYQNAQVPNARNSPVSPRPVS